MLNVQSWGFRVSGAELIGLRVVAFRLMLGTLEDIDFWFAGVHSTFQLHGAGVRF